MVKKIEGETVTLTSAELDAMRKEIRELKDQVQSQKLEPYEQIRQASIKNQGNNAQISIKHFTDHKKVALYHTNGFHIGKKIGPLHPGLLEYTFSVFKAKGIVLSTVCPSASEIEAYKQTEEYLALANRQKEIKPHRYKKQSAAETDKIIANFARQLGITSNDVMQIKPQEAVLK